MRCSGSECGSCPPQPGRLAAQAEPFDDGLVPGRILAHQVRKKATSRANELEQAAARVMILWVASQMLGQPRDALSEQRDLNFGRPCVAFLGGVIGNDACLRIPRKRQLVLQPIHIYLLAPRSLAQVLEEPRGRLA
jgi:hypothetical protein